MFVNICGFPFGVVVIEPEFAKLYRTIRKIMNKKKEQSLRFEANVGDIHTAGLATQSRLGLML